MLLLFWRLTHSAICNMKDLVEVRARITDDRRQQAARTLVGMSWDDENRIQRSKQTRCVAGGGGGE